MPVKMMSHVHEEGLAIPSCNLMTCGGCAKQARFCSTDGIHTAAHPRTQVDQPLVMGYSSRPAHHLFVGGGHCWIDAQQATSAGAFPHCGRTSLRLCAGGALIRICFRR